MVLLACLGQGAGDAAAQAVRIAVEEAPLAQALAQFRTQTGVDVVFSQRLIQDRTVTCTYEGDQVEAALACLLEGTGLRADRVRRSQYVLVEVRPPPAAAPVVRRGTLAGFVVDARTQELLPGAHVYLREQRVGTITNEGGYFALPALNYGAHRVSVSYLGYSSVDTLLALPGGRAVIQLEPVTLATDGVVVEESRADLAGVPGVVSTPVSDLEQMPSSFGGTDLFDALQWMPGVERAGEANGGLVVRGSGPDQNLYLLDGAPVYHPWHAFSLISTFQTEIFKDIKLYRGAFPAEHGGRLSSVLDAELRDGSLSDPRAVAAINALNARLLIESPISRNSSFMIAWRRSFIDRIIGERHPVEDDRGRRDTLRTGYYFFDWSAKLSFRPTQRSHLSLSYYKGRDVLDLRLPFDLSRDFSSWLRPADLFFEVGQNWSNRLYNVRYQYLYSSRFFLTLTAYDSSYEAAEGAFIQPTTTASVVSAYSVQLRDLGLKLDVDYYASLNHSMRFGLQAVNRTFQSRLDATVQHTPSIVDEQAQRSTLEAAELVAYVQDTWKPAARWQVQPGLRLSYFGSGGFTRLSPRLSVQYAVHPENLVFRAAVGSQVQYIHRLRDRFSFLYDLVSSRWIPASDQVDPSRSLQVAVGAESRPRPWLVLYADAYWRGARRVLLPRDEFQQKEGIDGPGIEVGTLLGQYTLGREKAYGVELAARVERGKWTSLVGYTGARAFNRAPELGEDRYRPARYDVPRSFQGTVRRTGLRWTFALSTVFRSGYPLTVPEGRYALGSPLDAEPVRYLYRPALNNGRLPPYLRFDVMAGYNFTLLGARWLAQLTLYNVVNRRNVVGRVYDPAQTVVRGDDRLGLPILPLLELKMNL